MCNWRALLTKWTKQPCQSPFNLYYRSLFVRLQSTKPAQHELSQGNVNVLHRNYSFTHNYGQFALSLGKGSLDFRRLPGPVDECGLIFPNSGG